MTHTTKDRYSYILTLYLVLFVAVLIWAHYRPKGVPGMHIALIAFGAITAYAFRVATRGGRYHWEGSNPMLLDGLSGLDIEYKSESGCGFTPETPESREIDGLRIDNRRYKAVNGTDVVIMNNGEVVPAGLGSSLMQRIMGGGWEPRSIQGDECW